MKKFFSFLAAAAMLFTASCSNDDLGEDEGREALVSFSMNLDGVSSTKADIGKGTLVDQLQYAVFEITKNDAGEVTSQKFLHKYETKNVPTWPAQVDIRLAKNKSYRVVFWAQDASCKAYTVTDDMNVTVDYAGINNDETRDAFFGYSDLENVAGSIKQDVTLKRPFAQLNVGVTAEDWQGALNSGVEMTHSTVTVNQVANTINLFNGEIGDNNTSVTYTMATRPNEQLYVDITDDGVENFNEYYYLSMSYLLVEQNNVSADFKFSTAETGGHEISLNIPTVPVTRNHRTNILGQILTGNVTFNVYIDARFDDDYNTNVTPDVVVMNQQQLQDAINAAQAGYTTTIVFGKDIVGDVTIPQNEGINLIINGAQFKYDGTMTIRGNNRSEGAETLVIRNVNFETATASEEFIWSNDQNAPNRYSHNVTIENCTFTATGAAKNTAVGFKLRQAYNIAMKGCTATDMHSMLQAYSFVDMVVDGATINGEKNGLSFDNVSATVSNSNINVKGYGIRYNGTANNYYLTVKDNNITAFQPVIVRKMTATGNVFNFEGANTLTASGAYQVVITNGNDDEEYVAPTGTYTLNGADNFIVFPKDLVVMNAAELQKAIDAAQKGDVIYVAAGQYNKVIDVTGGKDITIQAQTTKSRASSVVIAGLDHQTNGTPSTVRVKGIVFDNSIAEGWFTGTAQNIAPCVGAWGGYFTFENCEFVVEGTSGRETGVMTWWTTELVTMTFKNCTFNGKGDHDSARAMQIYGNVNMTVEGCTFNTKKDYTLKYVADEGNVATFKNNVVNNSKNFVELGSSVYPGKNYTANIINNTYGKGVNTHVIANEEGQIVNVDGVIKQASTSDEIADAIKEGATEITLAKNVNYGTITVGELKNVTITGDENSVMIFKTDANTKIENVTLKNVKFEYTGATADCGIVVDANAQIDNLVIEECTFIGTGAKAGRGISGYNNNASIKINKCTFKDLGYPIYAWGGYESLIVEGCTFDNIKSWAIMPQSGFNGDLTVNKCTFKNCLGGGLIKAGTLTAGHTFTFTDNVITGCTIAGDHNWFQFNVSAGTKVISGNKMDGVDWTPGTAEGLK